MRDRLRAERVEWKPAMKPSVKRLSCVPRTALLCCPSCYRVISHAREEAIIECEACRTTVANPERAEH